MQMASRLFERQWFKTGNSLSTNGLLEIDQWNITLENALESTMQCSTAIKLQALYYKCRKWTLQKRNSIFLCIWLVSHCYTIHESINVSEIFYFSLLTNCYNYQFTVNYSRKVKTRNLTSITLPLKPCAAQNVAEWPHTYPRLWET